MGRQVCEGPRAGTLAEACPAEASQSPPGLAPSGRQRMLVEGVRRSLCGADGLWQWGVPRPRQNEENSSSRNSLETVGINY